MKIKIRSIAILILVNCQAMPQVAYAIGEKSTRMLSKYDFAELKKQRMMQKREKDLEKKRLHKESILKQKDYNRTRINSLQLARSVHARRALQKKKITSIAQKKDKKLESVKRYKKDFARQKIPRTIAY